MPELPEVETVRAGLAPLLCGRVIEQVRCHRAGLRYPFPDLQQLRGRRIRAVRRRAKYLLFDTDGFDTDGAEAGGNAGANTLVWHLGMTGQFHLLPQHAARGAHEHVRIDLDDEQSLRYRDARRFGYAGLIPTGEIDVHPWFAALGPEPLSDAFNGDYLAAVCAGRKAPLKTVIMDAGVVVGVGNIYAAESLFRAGIHPARAAGRISVLRLARLVDHIRAVLREAIAAGGSTISDFVQADGKPGYFAHSFQVYGRAGEPCVRCDKPIRRITQASRSTFYCPGCQR